VPSRTLFAAMHESVVGTKRTCEPLRLMSAVGGEADTPRASRAGRFGAVDPEPTCPNRGLERWLAAALVLGPVHWTARSAFVLNLVVFALCLLIVEPFRLVRMPPTTRPWYDFVIRASMVALLVGLVVTLSFRIGPAGSGVLAVFPVIYTSIMVILHCRIGGPATAAVLANAVPGLAGFGAASLTLHLTAVPLGSAAALVGALGVSVAWNAVVYATRRHRAIA
jgi:hypothetical protein